MERQSRELKELGPFGRNFGQGPSFLEATSGQQPLVTSWAATFQVEQILLEGTSLAAFPLATKNLEHMLAASWQATSNHQP